MSNGALFTPPTPAEMESQFGTRFPTSGGRPTATMYVHKFAEWCASEDFIVAAVFCADKAYADLVLGEDAAETAGIFSSRVMLIDISDPAAPIYVDLTEVIEATQLVDVGTWAGIFSTCAKVPGDLPVATPPWTLGLFAAPRGWP